jgi:hypothetical protein
MNNFIIVGILHMKYVPVGREKQTFSRRLTRTCITVKLENCISCLKNVRQCEVTYRKYALKQENRIGVRFIKYDRYTGCIFKMCRNFTYEVIGQRRKLKAI